MKNIKKIVLLVTIVLLGTLSGYSQKGYGHGHGRYHKKKTYVNRNGVVVVKSRYRPRKVVVYHPAWGPKRNYNRRWVYFPRYNFYWDNWRGMYVYRNSTVWVVNSTPPPTVINVNLDNEKQYELKEDEDDLDDVYNVNDSHQSEYKPD